MANAYSMNETMTVGKKGSIEIEKFLTKRPETVAVINVENDRRFQLCDIDLLWVYRYKKQFIIKAVEIKADRYSHTGNYFIETVSNKNKGSPGCFLYTEAHYLFYYFIDIRELNIIPMPDGKEWFEKNKHRFQEKHLATTIGDKKAYGSSGMLVPKSIMNKEVKGVRTIYLKG